VAENTTAVTTVAAGDADGDTLTYSIVGGADAAPSPSMPRPVPRLRVRTDYENPTDVGHNNVYDVTVQVSDVCTTPTRPSPSRSQRHDNAPVITSPATAGVAENTTAVTTVAAGDADATP